mgnify:CR=1 FL=1
MEVSLEQINRNILLLRKEIERVANIVEESYLEIDDEVDNDVKESRGEKGRLISHEEMKKEFGDCNRKFRYN